MIQEILKKGCLKEGFFCFLIDTVQRFAFAK